jgi:hypothetical protein
MAQPRANQRAARRTYLIAGVVVSAAGTFGVLVGSTGSSYLSSRHDLPGHERAIDAAREGPPVVGLTRDSSARPSVARVSATAEAPARTRALVRVSPTDVDIVVDGRAVAVNDAGITLEGEPGTSFHVVATYRGRTQAKEVVLGPEDSFDVVEVPTASKSQPRTVLPSRTGGGDRPRPASPTAAPPPVASPASTPIGVSTF